MRTMKLAVICAALISMLGFTSCLKGSENNEVTGGEIVKVDLTGFKTLYGATIVPANSSVLTSLMNYEYALITYTYDKSTVVSGSNKVTATINGYMGITSPNNNYVMGGQDTTGMAQQTGANSPIITLSEKGETSWMPQLFSKNLIFLPIGFKVKDGASDAEKANELQAHMFRMYYAKSDMKNGTITIYVRHSVSDPQNNKDRKSNTWQYYGFNIGQAINDYKTLNNADPDRIIFAYDQIPSTAIDGSYDQSRVTPVTMVFEYSQWVNTYFKGQQ